MKNAEEIAKTTLDSKLPIDGSLKTMARGLLVAIEALDRIKRDAIPGGAQWCESIAREALRQKLKEVGLWW